MKRALRCPDFIVLAAVLSVFAAGSLSAGTAPDPGAPRGPDRTREPSGSVAEWIAASGLATPLSTWNSVHGVAATAAPPVDAGGSWSRLIGPLQDAPGARLDASVVYDPGRRRLVLFGGNDFTFNFVDVWEMPVDAPGSWTRLVTAGTGPAGRIGQSTIYDSVRDRMVVFGGATLVGAAGDAWALSLGATPTWSRIVASGTAPRLQNHAAIYDPVRDRMLVFGGNDGTTRNDVWALSLGGTPEWQLLGVAGTRPSPRVDHVAIYDASSDRMIVHGGLVGTSNLSDAWALSLSGTPTWDVIVTSGTVPAPRGRHAAVYDAPRNRMVIFGGSQVSSDVGFGDVWALPLTGPAQWSRIVPQGIGPGSRWGSSMTYVPSRDRLVIFGGRALHGSQNDTFELIPEPEATWGPSARTRLAPSRWGHVAVMDQALQRMLVFGGLGTAGPLGDLWSLDVSGVAPRWMDLSSLPGGPSARFGHAAVLDPVRNRMIVFGGFDGAFRNDVWQLTLGSAPAWSLVDVVGGPPSGRDGCSLVYDSARDRIVMFGGFDGAGALADVWTLSLAGTPRWLELEPLGTSPSARQQHSAVYDPDQKRMLVFGGTAAGASGFDDVWQLKLAGMPQWKRLAGAGPGPGPRWGQSTTFDPARHRVVLFGGVDPIDWRSDTWFLSLQGRDTWTRVDASLVPGARFHHTAALDGDRLLVYGGLFSTSILGDTWALDLVGPSPAVTAGPVADRTAAALGQPASPSRMPSFALAGVRPDPVVGSFSVLLSLPTSKPARIEAFDVRGRRVWEANLESPTPGEHIVRVGSGVNLPAGAYWVKLEQGERRASARFTVLR